MSLRQRLPAALLLLLGASVSRTAQAQSLTIANNSKGVVWASAHAFPDHIDWINRQDCLDNSNITFNINTGTMPASFTGYELQAWIGSACDMAVNRQGQSPPCKFLGSSN